MGSTRRTPQERQVTESNILGFPELDDDSELLLITHRVLTLDRAEQLFQEAMLDIDQGLSVEHKLVEAARLEKEV
jgi:hypothetical protein